MKLVSGLCHPLLMATYMSAVMLLAAPELFAFPERTSRIIVLTVFLTTCAIPAFSIYTLKLVFSKVSNLELTKREERPLPFSFIFIWYGVSTYLFVFRLGIDEPFSTMMFAMTLLIGILLIITKWYKVSIHAAAMWSAVGIVAALIFGKSLDLKAVLVVAILLAGLTNTSRLYLGYHKPKEIWLGSGIGLLFSFLAIYLFG